jgi:hypothetical protein
VKLLNGDIFRQKGDRTAFPVSAGANADCSTEGSAEDLTQDTPQEQSSATFEDSSWHI